MGAAVAYNSQAYIFLSATTKGKSTLTSFLTSEGLAYITDDCVLIEEKTLKVVPFNTPIHLRAGGKGILERRGFLFDGQCVFTSEMDRYVYIPNNMIDTKLPVAKIFFSSFGQENVIEDISHQESFLKMLYSPITEYKINLDYIKKISTLSQISSYNITYSDMDFVKKCIRQCK